MPAEYRYLKPLAILIAALVILNVSAVVSAGQPGMFVNSFEMEFVLIPAGTFIMGSLTGQAGNNESEVQHTVKLSRPFYMQTTEVTLGQWRSLMGKKLFGPRKGPDNEPVTRVSWQDCMKFIKKLNHLEQGNYRLPTEAEWEYACRAGSTTTYSWGNDIDCSRAMYGNNSLKARECIKFAGSRGIAPDGPAPVKSYPPNAWGLYDMHGNVWEWCQDDYSEHCFEHHTGARNKGDGNPMGTCDSGMMIDPVTRTGGMAKSRRGGSWYKHAGSLRSANRAYAHAFSKLQTTGFRLVREAD